jgi:hypothetical protein
MLSLLGNAQLTRDLHTLYHPAYFNQVSDDSTDFDPWRINSSNKPSYSVEVGTSYSTFGGGLSSSYISPTVSFKATEKLHIVAGGKFTRANMGSIPFLNSEMDQMANQQMSGNPTEAFAYGHYQINEKLSVYGMGAFGKNQLYISPFQSGVTTTDYQQLSFGMDYKISEKFSIGASFGVNNGPAWGISPFGYNSRMSPFFP